MKITEEELIKALDFKLPGTRDTVDYWVGTQTSTGGYDDKPIPENEQTASLWTWKMDNPKPTQEQLISWVNEWKDSAEYGSYTLVKAAKDARSERDNKLSALDSVAGNQLRFAELTPDQQAELADYRQLLLDVPQQEGFPLTIDWPAMPVI